jgi:hypothetical protein
MTTTVNADRDVSLSELLAETRLNGLMAIDQFRKMEQSGQDVSYITSTLQRDGLNPFVKCCF